MAATDARPVPRKNAAFRVTFAIYDADGDLVTAAAGLDSEVSIDGGTFADATNEATEIATSSGMYFLDLTAAEMNGDTIAVIVKTSTAGAKTTVIVMYPQEAGDIRVDVDTWRATAPNVLIAGRADASVGAMAADVVTSTAIATDAIGASEFAQGAADKVWSSATRTLTAFSTALALSVWDVLETAILTASSIGLKVKNNLDAAITTRLAPTVASRTLDVAVGGEAGIDLDNTVGTLAKTTDITGFNDLSAAQVNAEVVDALNVDTYAQPGQETPAATQTIRAMLAYLYKAWRNRFTQDASDYKLYNDDAVTVDQKAAVSDDGTTFNRSETGTGP